MCEICLDPFDDEMEIIPLQLCEHVFHMDCMSHYLQTQVASNIFPMKCPHTECKHEVSDSDVQEILNEEIYLRYSNMALTRAIEQNKDMSWCPTPDCKYAFVYNKEVPQNTTTPGEGENNSNEQLKCPLCTLHYCLTCRAVYHEG